MKGHFLEQIVALYFFKEGYWTKTLALPGSDLTWRITNFSVPYFKAQGFYFYPKKGVVDEKLKGNDGTSKSGSGCCAPQGYCALAGGNVHLYTGSQLSGSASRHIFANWIKISLPGYATVCSILLQWTGLQVEEIVVFKVME